MVLLHGVDTRQLHLNVLRKSVASVPQQPLIYAGSLRENLDPECFLGDDLLWEALDHVEMSSFVRKSQGGLDMTISESGGNLSAGQRQLLTVARATLRRSRLVVCDEATSSCDPHTDMLVQRVLQGHDCTKGKRPGASQGPFAEAAMLSIAHRLDTLSTCDRVLVLSAPMNDGATSVLEIVRPHADPPVTDGRLLRPDGQHTPSHHVSL